ncbi:methyl-accepting chemotaxis protein [Domibacillus indicus]|uniref:methyl-accepting chemotaxis protein n=1 Tax=Domibacillus indicus TaxID=1437523 RepID=UPI0006182F90|nr:HAMP domain-containing methyl-accepting chemotaxis protein [Domibacillus indicus]
MGLPLRVEKNGKVSKFGIKTKLILTFISVIILFAAALAISIIMNNRISELTDDIVSANKKMKIIENVNMFAKSANGDAAQYLLAPENLQSNFKERYLSDAEMVENQIKTLKTVTTDKSELKQIKQFTDEWNAFTANVERLSVLYDAGDTVKAQQSFTKKSFDPVAFSLLSYSFGQEELIGEKEKAISNYLSMIKYINIIVPIFVIIVALTISNVFSNRITRRIKTIQDHALEIANGNLVVDPIEIKNQDELSLLASSFNTMVMSLKELIGGADSVSSQVAASASQLQASAEQTSSATEHISSVMQEIASGTGRQVEDIVKNQGIIENVSAGMSNIMTRTDDMTKSIQISNETSVKGKVDLNNATNQVKKIETSTNRMSRVIQELDHHSIRIGEIISVITDIAEQTNLLALNASIEAARAGEHGKGFAVVAAEVRTLAEKSRASADEIKNLVATIQQETANTVTEMETGKGEVEKGLQLIEIANESFYRLESLIKDITEENEVIRNITVKVSEDARIANEQMTAVSSISNENASGIENVSAATEEQMASMEEVASSTVALAIQAEELKNLIGKFTY